MRVDGVLALFPPRSGAAALWTRVTGLVEGSELLTTHHAQRILELRDFLAATCRAAGALAGALASRAAGREPGLRRECLPWSHQPYPAGV